MAHRTVTCQVENKQFTFRYNQLSLANDVATLSPNEHHEITDGEFYKNVLIFQRALFETSVFDLFVIKALRDTSPEDYVEFMYANVPYEFEGVWRDYAYVLRPDGNVVLMLVDLVKENE
jgi:hypothetical protein